MMKNHWNLVSTCLLVIICVGYAAAQSVDGTCNGDNAKETAKITVNVTAKGWAPDGPPIPVQVVAKGGNIKSIQIWAEFTNGNTHVGSWTLMPGYKFTNCGIGMSTIASKDNLNVPQITYEWKPPRSDNGPIQVIPGKGTPSQGNQNQGTPTPSQGTAAQNALIQDETFSQDAGTQPEMASPTPSASSSKNDKRSLIARQGTTGNSTSSFGPIVFKGVVQLGGDSAIYSFKSGIIPISNIPTGIPSSSSSGGSGVSSTGGGQSQAASSKSPSSTPRSAANSKFLFKGFNLLFALALSVTLVAL